MNSWRRSKQSILFTLIILGSFYIIIFERSGGKTEISHLLDQENKYNYTALETEVIDNVEKPYRQSNLKSHEEYERNYKQLNRNFPIHLFQEKITYFDQNGCIKFPKILDLRFSSTFWQSLKFKRNSNAYFLSAYYDNRELVENAPVIRIMSTILNVDIPSVKYCQLWYPNDKKVVVSSVSSAIHMDPWSYHVHTYILTCDIPSEYSSKVPAAVSLVEDKCDLAKNVLPVHYNLPETDGEKEDFAICIKAIFYPEKDISYHLVQYAELAKILGIHKIYIYSYAMHPNMSEVLRYYSNQNRVEVIPYTIPGTRPNLPAVQAEFLKPSQHSDALYERAAHNDCFYMNIHRYKYIAFWDMDELLTPLNGKTWKEVIDDTIKTEQEKKGNKYQPPSVYLAIGAEFLEQLRIDWTPDIPQYMSMLQNIYRTDVIPRHTKQLVDTQRVLGISNHLPLKCFGKCIAQRLNTSLAILSHFKKSSKRCATKNSLCEGRRDTNIWEYKEALIKQVDEALGAIGLL